MNQLALFSAALGLAEPWQVVDVGFDAAAGRIDLQVAVTPGARFACPDCGAEHQPVHDTLQRQWRHLNFFQFQAYIHAKVPGAAGALRALWQDHAGSAALGTSHQRLHPADGSLDRHPVPGDDGAPGGAVACRE